MVVTSLFLTSLMTNAVLFPSMFAVVFTFDAELALII